MHHEHTGTGHRSLGFLRVSGWGMLLAALWFLIYGLMNVFGLHFANDGVILGIIALVAGILLLLGK